jgi:hypothetical protein
MIPLQFVEPVEGGRLSFSVEIDRLTDLLPGRSPGLDVICDGILNGSPFIYPAELVAA